ncbi:hypothetical protein ACFWN7_07825 [Agromyces sp. NPDC058484]|uniref:hypothetical protein n=1 Tax=Agromyces sp. NPDC058484 TaxID=3346524 RepID=UPI00365C4259
MPDDERRREEQRRRDVVAPVLEPLLYATSELQSRVHNLVAGGLAEALDHGSEWDRRAITEYTCFVFAQYFGWVEALRRSVLLRETTAEASASRLSLGDVPNDGQLTITLITREINDALRVNSTSRDFMLYSGEQHAIGAAMFRWEDLGDRRAPSVARFDEFTERYRAGGSFREWFAGIETGLEMLRNSSSTARLCQVQGLLVLLMDQLDPGHLVFKKRETLIPRAELHALFDTPRTPAVVSNVPILN